MRMGDLRLVTANLMTVFPTLAKMIGDKGLIE